MKKKILGWISMIAGALGAVYVGGYLLALCPVIKVLDLIADKMLTMSVLLWSMVKITFAIPIAYLFCFIGFTFAAYFWID